MRHPSKPMQQKSPPSESFTDAEKAQGFKDAGRIAGAMEAKRREMAALLAAFERAQSAKK